MNYRRLWISTTTYCTSTGGIAYARSNNVIPPWSKGAP